MVGYLEIVCGIAAVAVLLYYYLVCNYDFWKVRGVRGPKPIPFFGNVKDVILERRNLNDYLKEVYQQYRDEPMFGIFVRRTPTLVITDPALIKDVLIKDFNNFADRGLDFSEAVEPLTAHLFNLEPKRWRPLRTRLSPVFTSGKLKDMFKMILDCSEHLEKSVANVVAKGEPIDVRELTARFTTDVIGTCAFGIETKALAEEDSTFRRMGRQIFIPTLKFKLRLYMPSVYKALGVIFEEKEFTNFFVGITLETMRHRRENKIYRNDFINTLIDIDDNPEKLGDLKLTDKLIAAQAFVFFAAGFETSSTTMSSALYELALNQDTQERLRSEIKETYLNNGGNMDYETVKKMEYLDAVFRETLRKHPPVLNLMRQAQSSYTFEGTEVTIPKGQKVLIPTYVIHRDPRIYPNPDVFDPNRFRDGNENSRHPMNYLPFGDGPRNCIGARFAVYQTKIGLIKIIRDYKVDVCEKTPNPFTLLPNTLLLMPIERIYLKFSKYEGS